MSRSSNSLAAAAAIAALLLVSGPAGAQTPNPPGGGSGSGSGINQLTGDVTAGPGSNSVVATVVNLSGVANASLANAGLVNPATTVNGQSCVLGAACTVTATASGVSVGTTTISSGTSNGLLFDNAGVLGNLATVNSGVLVTSAAGAPSISSTLPTGLAMGTPGSITLTNGTGLPIGGITGLGTGVGTLLAGTSSGTGGPAGTTSPSFTTPTIGVATATSLNKVTITAPATSATLTIANSKTLTANNTITLTGTDGSSVAFGAGGTIGPAGYAALGQIPGQTTATVASAGNIGEYISSTVAASSVSLTSGTTANLTSISLPAGTWDVQVSCSFTGAAATTVQLLQCSLSTTTATLDTTYQTDAWFPSATTLFNSFSDGIYRQPVVTERFNLSGTTTIFATSKATFGTSTATGGAVIRATRIL